VTRHTAGHRVNTEHNFGAVLFQLLRELSDRVLGLGDGEAIAGDDHDPVGGIENHCDVVG